MLKHVSKKEQLDGRQHGSTARGPESGSSGPLAAIARMQRTHGNQALQRLLRGQDARPAAPEVEEEEKAAEVGTGAGAGAESSVQENFTPAEGEERPDEGLYLAQVGVGGTGQQPVPEEEEEKATAPPVGFVDLGQTGTVAYGSNPVVDEDEDRPHAFTDGGQTGTVKWAGGGGAGAHGNESTGSIQSQTAPVFDSSPPPAAGGNAEAWVKAGTGKANVTRSWVGIASGDQGNGHFVTVAAAARINSHETLHVASTKGIYNANIKPLLERVDDHGPTKPKTTGATAAAAVTALQAIIKWPATITAFQTADTAANKPNGPVDAADIATGSYPVDAGAGTVAGKAYQHRVRTPSEANPAP